MIPSGYSSSWRLRAPSSGHLQELLSRWLSVFGHFIAFLLRERIHGTPQKFNLLERTKIPGKKQRLSVMELEKLRAQLKSQLQQHQVGNFLLRTALTNYLHNCYLHADEPRFLRYSNY